MAASSTPFWVDEVYDREYASDGVSRFGAYVRDRLNSTFAECWGDFGDSPGIRLAEFASASWRTASGPVMAPGYVRSHTRVLGAQVQRSGWDGSLVGSVGLVAPWPERLLRSDRWQGGLSWRDWPTELCGKGYDFVHPTEEDVTRRPLLQTSLALSFPVPMHRLPAVPYGPRDGVEHAARAMVSALVVELNALVQPVLEELDGGRLR
ncbi:hypothetical protein [Actinomadura litoris]|uniref:hypothetical protein n=1 Tax=Actinomadura litoris TaxID=2678616 RepID=UPI001FA7B064|nr:hypothetical protein [Actinomadura litoris]